MAFEPDSSVPTPSPVAARRPLSTWFVLALAAVLLVLFVAAGPGLFGVAVWLLIMGFLLLITATYGLVFRRQTWARASDGKKRLQLLAAGGGVFVLGIILAVVTLPPDQSRAPAEDESASPSPTSQSPTDGPLANKECTLEAETISQGSIEYVCTPDSNGKLIWLDKETSEKLTESRKLAEEAQREADQERKQAEDAQRQAEEDRKQAEEAQRQAEEAAAAEEAQRQAEEAAAAEEAQRQAEEAAAAEEAQRQAEEAQRQAEEAAAAEEARRAAEEQAQKLQESFVYSNCTAVQDAGAAPIHRGDYGWQDALDRDGDGVACAGD
ncbi:MAG: excalibur calcium-binding domain-containing protein [Arthrobacter sp.]